MSSEANYLENIVFPCKICIYERFFLACDEELSCHRQRPKAEDKSGDSKPETAQEKPLVPGLGYITVASLKTYCNQK